MRASPATLHPSARQKESSSGNTSSHCWHGQSCNGHGQLSDTCMLGSPGRATPSLKSHAMPLLKTRKRRDESGLRSRRQSPPSRRPKSSSRTDTFQPRFLMANGGIAKRVVRRPCSVVVSLSPKVVAA
eukprot:15453031-Alexandrium_andersonii.AAC.1